MTGKFPDYTFWRFIMVGVLNTLVGSAVMFSAYNLLPLNYWVSSALNYIVGSVVSYLLNKKFTFKSKKSSKTTVPRFVLNISLCYLIAYGAAKPIMGKILSSFGENIRENGAMVFGMGLFVMLNYVGQRLFVFKKEEK